MTTTHTDDPNPGGLTTGGLTHRESARRESARRESARRESARRESAHRESAHRESAHRESAHCESARHESAHRESAHCESAHCESARHDSVLRDLAVRDLTDPLAGPHAVQLMVAGILAAVVARYRGALRVERGRRIVEVADNYDRLGYGADARARDVRYTRYVDDTRMLRSQTSALIPPALRALARADPLPAEVLIACPGLVYRRDVIDRLHTGTPHQLDLWRLTTAPTPAGLGRPELLDLVATVLAAALPGVRWRANPADHPYTDDGLEIEAWVAGRWVEVGECGRAARPVLAGAGLPPYARGLALGLGLDRLVMLRKGVPDIRLLRSADPRVAGQMLDLAPWRPVSAHPPARRDVSVAMAAGVTAEEVGDRVRECLGPDARLVEEVAVRYRTPVADLPVAARERLGIEPGEVNLLLRVVLRDLDGSVPGAVANGLRDRIHLALHHAGRA